MRFVNEVEIGRPVEDVFAYLADFENVPEWNYAIERTTKVSEGPVAVGTTYRQIRNIPRRSEESFSVTVFEPDRRLAIRGTLGPFDSELQYRLEPIGQRTQVINEVELTPRGILGMVGRLASSRVKEAVASNLRELKRLLETRAGGVTGPSARGGNGRPTSVSNQTEVLGGIDMISRSVDLSPRKAAQVAGFGYLGVLVFATLPMFLIDPLIVRGDAATTAANITASESAFRLGFASWLVVLAFDAVVAWALYIFLEPVGRHLSLLAAWFRLVFAAILGSALVSLLAVPRLLGIAGGPTAFEPDQLDLAMLFLHPYEHAFNVGFIFFGLHVFFLGYLILRTDYVPRVLGVLLLIASAGYFIDSFASIVSSAYADNEGLFILFVAVPAIVAEYSLALWLLIKGGKGEQRETAVESSRGPPPRL